VSLLQDVAAMDTIVFQLTNLHPRKCTKCRGTIPEILPLVGGNFSKSQPLFAVDPPLTPLSDYKLCIHSPRSQLFVSFYRASLVWKLCRARYCHRPTNCLSHRISLAVYSVAITRRCSRGYCSFVTADTDRMSFRNPICGIKSKSMDSCHFL